MGGQVHTKKLPSDVRLLQGGPERALVDAVEIVHDRDVVGLQGQPLPLRRVVADLWPGGKTVGARCAGADELAPVVDHLLRQRLLSGGAQRGRIADVEQIAQFQRVAGPPDRKGQGAQCSGAGACRSLNS